MEQFPDQHYISEVLQGNTAAFAGLVDRYRNMVFAIAVKVTGNATDAEDVAQEAFVKAYQSLGRFKGDASFSTWLYRIAYNHAIDRQRQMVRKGQPINLEKIGIEPASNEVHPADRYDVRERSERIRNAIEKLPAEDRTIVLLYYFENLPLREIAAIVSRKENHVKVKLHRIRTVLGRLLQAEAVHYQ